MKKILFLILFSPCLVFGQNYYNGLPFTAVTASDITDTTTTVLKSAGGTNVVYFISAISVSNLSATTDTRVDILDGSTTIWQCAASKSGGGCTQSFPVALKGTANSSISCKAANSTVAVRCAVSGYLYLQ